MLYYSIPNLHNLIICIHVHMKHFFGRLERLFPDSLIRALASFLWEWKRDLFLFYCVTSAPRSLFEHQGISSRPSISHSEGMAVSPTVAIVAKILHLEGEHLSFQS